MDYRDLTIDIGTAPDGSFSAHVTESIYGSGSKPFHLEFGTDPSTYAETLEDKIRAKNQTETSRLATLRQAGTDLFSRLFGGDVLSHLTRCLAWLDGRRAAEHTDGLRIRLRFPHVSLDDRTGRATSAALQRIPWELLCQPESEFFLARSEATPVVRTVDVPVAIKPLAVKPPLKVLLAMASPEDLKELNLDAEIAAIHSALESIEVVETRVTRARKTRELRDELRDGGFHVLHFMGHGGFNTETGQGHLTFEQHDGKARRVDGHELAEFLMEVPTLRIVVLNACKTGRVGSVASALNAAGIPAVVAMRRNIGNADAIGFSEEFYTALAASFSIEAAVTDGRRAIGRNSWQWTTPALLMRAPDGKVLHWTRNPDEPDAEERLEVGILSFDGWGKRQITGCDYILSLLQHFDQRRIRSKDDWHHRIVPKLQRFLAKIDAESRPVLFDFAAHATIAFATGHLYEAKSGADMAVRQRLMAGGVLEWALDDGEPPTGDLWNKEDDNHDEPLELDSSSSDVALALSITQPIHGDVRRYLREQKIPISKLLSLEVGTGIGQTAVKNGAHAFALAQEVSNLLRTRRSAAERRGCLHIFGAAPNVFFFFLGRLSRSFGPVQLYEYNFDSNAPGAYTASLALPISPPS